MTSLVYPLLISLILLIYFVFFRKAENKIESFINFSFACFGHPIYLVLGHYIATILGLRSPSNAIGLIGVDYTVYITILLSLFLLRYIFFLYNAWIKTRSAITAIHPYAFDKFVRIHKYCVFGLLFFIFPQGAGAIALFFLYVMPPIFFLGAALGFVQSAYAYGVAMTPEKWIPDVVVIRDDEDVQMIVPPEELKRRRYARAYVWALGVMIVGISAAVFIRAI